MAGRPTHRITISRKDGQDINYTDYKGDKKSGKYAPVGALFPSNRPGTLTFVLERKVTLDPELYWINVYENTPREGDAAEAPRAAARNRRAPAAAPAAADEGDIDFGDGTDELA